MSSLYPQGEWDQGYEQIKFAEASGDLAAWMRSQLAAERGGRCFEIGCFPGGFLALCGKLGYELNGIDLTPRVDTDLPEWLRLQGYKVGRIAREDFLAATPMPIFDLVYSNGFLEHFPDWVECLRRHAAWVKPGGILIVTVPNFAGRLQRALHMLLDEHNLAKHNLLSMDPRLWAKVLGGEFEILDLGWFGRFDFWVGEQKRGLLRRILVRGLIEAKPMLQWLLPATARMAWAPSCGLAARKRPEQEGGRW